MTRIKFAAALAAALFLTAVGGQGYAQTGKDFDETARYLAGLPRG